MTAEATPAVPLEPRDGIPDVVDTPAGLAEAIDALRGGTGPVAVDAERASGFRYGQRAYLVQVRRAGSRTWLIDPIALPDLSGLSAALGGAEWVLHSASQDLPCLAEVGLRPPALFDTELAARLLGLPRVGLGPLVEAELGHHLEKGHGAADWSTRPLPESWRRYAALDVEVLVELRDHLAAALEEAGKAEWAAAEFESVRLAPPPAPRIDPWRRTSGIHRIRGTRGLAVVRALWEERERIARDIDTSPGRVLPDTAIVAAAQALPADSDALARLPEFTGRGARRRIRSWAAALASALALPEDDLPPVHGPGDGPPPARAWRERDPQAAARLDAVRSAMAVVAESTATPAENLLSPEIQRRLAWRPPDLTVDPESAASVIAERLADLGARTWQIDLAAGPIAAALVDSVGSPEPAAGATPGR